MMDRARKMELAQLIVLGLERDFTPEQWTWLAAKHPTTPAHVCVDALKKKYYDERRSVAKRD